MEITVAPFAFGVANAEQTGLLLSRFSQKNLAMIGVGANIELLGKLAGSRAQADCIDCGIEGPEVEMTSAST